jgi:GMP synthase (glutamine-hydrolysing)
LISEASECLGRQEEIANIGRFDAIRQAFAVLLPVRTVGVMGDARTYEWVCGLRAMTPSEGMTADFYPFDKGFLGRVAGRIVNELRGINHVVCDATSEQSVTIEWE